MTGIQLLEELVKKMRICHRIEFINQYGWQPDVRGALRQTELDLDSVLRELSPNEYYEYMTRQPWLIALVTANGNTAKYTWPQLSDKFPNCILEPLSRVVCGETLKLPLELFVWFFYAQAEAYLEIDFPEAPIKPSATLTTPKQYIAPKRQPKVTKTVSKPGQSGRTRFSREDGALNHYLEEISQIPLIKAKEEVRLAQRIKQGDKQALDKLVRANLRFVVSVAKKYQHRGLPLADLINDGNIGLIKAAKRFDETRGFKFISYAVWWIRQAVLQSLAEHSRIVRLPLNRVGTLHKINRSINHLAQKIGREPSPEEIAEVLEISEQEVVDTIRIQSTSMSLDAPFEQGESSTLLDVIKDDRTPPPTVNTLRWSLRLEIEKVLDTLLPREAEVIDLYFGLNHQALNLEEIGRRFSLTRERIRQIKEKALQRLRFATRSRALRAYINADLESTIR